MNFLIFLNFRITLFFSLHLISMCFSFFFVFYSYFCNFITNFLQFTNIFFLLHLLCVYRKIFMHKKAKKKKLSFDLFLYTRTNTRIFTGTTTRTHRHTHSHKLIRSRYYIEKKIVILHFSRFHYRNFLGRT